MSTRKMIYVATPYSHRDEMVRGHRYNMAEGAVQTLLEAGIHAYSPIVASHPLHLAGMGGTWEFWRDYDLNMLARCDELFVYTITGWSESVGVAAEIDFARLRFMPVFKGNVGEFIKHYNERGEG